MTANKPKIYLLDIEGTVAPVSLVTEQLFPYARTHASEFIVRNLSVDASVRDDLVLLWKENQAEADPTSPRLPDPHRSNSPILFGVDKAQGGAAKQDDKASARPQPLELPELYDLQFPQIANMYINWLMDRDRKSTALKSLQGKIWKAGFESGELKGALFSDVPEAMARWAKEAKVAIYSSGSVEAQQLLFRHTTDGDLSSLIASYFDTRTGAKSESASYRSIAAQLGVDPGEVLFFSDVVRELNAAREAGCQTRLVLREGNVPVDDAQGHEPVTSLS